MNNSMLKTLFGIAAIYDGVLGIAFTFWPGQLFEAFQVTPPNHLGYVQFSALLLVMFAWLFLTIARDHGE